MKMIAGAGRESLVLVFDQDSVSDRTVLYKVSFNNNTKRTESSWTKHVGFKKNLFFVNYYIYRILTTKLDKQKWVLWNIFWTGFI